MKILGIIPARKNSSRLPGKHLRMCGGKPMIEWTIEAAKGSRMLTHWVISSNDQEVLGRYSGQLRPDHLCGPHVPSIEVAKYVYRQRAEFGNDEYDAVCLMQPTSPLRTADDIDECCARLLLNGWADSIVSYSPAGSQYTLVTNGAIYLSRVGNLAESSLHGANWLPYVMPAERGVDIDTAADLALADKLLS